MLPNDHQQVALGTERIQKATSQEDVSWNTSKTFKNHAVGQNMTLGNLIGIGLLGFVVPFLNFCCPKGMFLHVSWLQKTASNFTGTSFPEAFIHISAHQVLPCVCVSWNRCKIPPAHQSKGTDRTSRSYDFWEIVSVGLPGKVTTRNPKNTWEGDSINKHQASS